MRTLEIRELKQEADSLKISLTSSTMRIESSTVQANYEGNLFRWNVNDPEQVRDVH